MIHKLENEIDRSYSLRSYGFDKSNCVERIKDIVIKYKRLLWSEDELQGKDNE